jgi:archaellum biogenesis ATPase FlaH
MNHLFLIGIDKYSDPAQPDLKNCVKDVKDFRDILIDKYDFDSSRVYELYDEDATNRKIQDAFSGYIKTLDENSNLIIYFSGHGDYDEKTDRGFWVCHDSRADYSTFIPNEVLIGFIQKIKAKHIFLIADCCFSWSIFARDLAKNVSDFIDNPSRMALASGKGLTYETDLNFRPVNIFSQSILQFLRNAEVDFRVGTLIEAVKHEIGSDRRQTPQGARLIDSHDRGGEFIFKIVNSAFHSTKALKGNKDILTILKIFTNGRDVKEYFSFEDKSLKIGFKLFEETSSSVYDRKHYFLHLFDGINPIKTYDKFKSLDLDLKYNADKQVRNLTILLGKEKMGKTALSRKEQIKSLFKPVSIFFINDFIRDECTPKKAQNVSKDEEKYFIPNFILPKYVIENTKLDDESFMKEWLGSENQPIMIVKGTGGIGKTTFSQYIANEFLESNENASVLFIDSLETKHELLKNEKRRDKIDIYSFYIASQEFIGGNYYTLSEDLFRLNLDAGNILLIIDGLDEVISKVPGFDIDTFLQSITGYSNEIGNTKVIITCRSHFWEAAKYKATEIVTVDLLPFSLKQATSFFEKAFNGEKRKIDKSLKLTEEFQFPDELGNFYFNPYVLDVIKKIVESENEVTQYPTGFDSLILQQHVKSDFVIYRICHRERYYKDKVRILDLEVDEQIKFFLFWAIQRRGILTLANFGREMKEALKKSSIDNTTIEAFKSHPFVHVNRNAVSFRYDFFADYFKCIYVSEFIKLSGDNRTISQDFIKILVENCWYGSGMIMDIVNRLKVWTDDEILKCSDLMSQLLEMQELDLLNKRKALAALFNICLAANIRFKSNNIEQNTELVISLFGKGDEIVGLHIQNMHDSENVIRFDFTNLTLRNCYIENFNTFWDCKFNEQTWFIRCFLFGLKLEAGKRVPIPIDHFQDCTKDEDFDNAYNLDRGTIEKTDEQIRRNLITFFDFFFRGQKFEPQNYEKSYKGYDTVVQRYARIPNKATSLKRLVTYLEEKGVIRWSLISDVDVLRISDEYKADILSILKDGTPTKKFNDLVKDLRKLTEAK